jgi:hypothetical protein
MTYLCPPIGSVVTVVTQYRDAHYQNPTGFKQNRYERVPVVAKDAWTKPGEFCIPADNEPYITKRTIHVDNVVELVVHGSTAEIATETGTTFVTVPGSKGKEYTVTLVNGVAKSCECAGFTYRKHCRHLAEASGEKTMTNPIRPTLEPLMELPPVPSLEEIEKLRAAPRKPRKATPAKKAKKPTRTKAPTTAVQVRQLIRQHKDFYGEASDPKNNGLITEICTKVGFSRQLARAYIKANWSKV